MDLILISLPIEGDGGKMNHHRNTEDTQLSLLIIWIVFNQNEDAFFCYLV